MPATIRLPDATVAPGFRDSTRNMGQFRLTEVVPGYGTIHPAEGDGNVYPYFTAHRLCDANTDLTAAATWEPLRKLPAYEQNSPFATSPGAEPDPEWRARLLESADKLGSRGTTGSDFEAIQARIGAHTNEELPDYLAGQMPYLFEAYPEGSLWLLRTDELLVKRFALMRANLAIALTPDLIELGQPLPRLEALDEHSVTKGVHFDVLMDPLMLTFCPAAIGVTLTWMPHGLVFLFGATNAITIQQHPRSFLALYEPSIQSAHGLHWMDLDFFEDVPAAQAEALLQWWTGRLNVVYSYAVNPSNFTDSLGNLQPERQTAWFLTFERLLVDMLLVQTGFQGPALARQTAAFDLLDKAENLLGFTSKKTGKGFERMLRRRSMIQRLDAAWDRLPLQLRARFKAHTRSLFDAAYAHIREHALQHRLTPKCVRVGRGFSTKLMALPMESYVPPLIRAIRNSAHGLFEQLEGEDRYLLATHDGTVPPQLPDLTALIGFGLIAEAEALCDKTWLPTP